MTTAALIAAAIYTGWLTIRLGSERCAVALLGSYASQLDAALRRVGGADEADLIAQRHDLIDTPREHR